MKLHGNHVIGNLQQTSTYLADIGVVDAYYVEFLPPITGYTDGLHVTFKAETANTGPCTLEVDGYGPISIVKNVNQTLGVNDILAGEIVSVIYDGTYFQMMDNPEQPLSPFSTFLIDGGQITWLNNFNYTVSAANYVILGTQYASPQTNITLAPSDPTFDRFDLVVVDTNGTVQVITGIPSDPAQEPSYDPATQLPLAFINVPAGSTQPSCAFLYTVYKENTGTPTEWAVVSSSGTMVTGSTNNPRTGIKDIEGTAVASGATLTFTPDTPFDSTNVTNLVFYIRSKGSWGTTGSGQRFSITFNNAFGQIGIPVVLTPRGIFGFDSSTTGSYQQIVIDRDLFNFSDGQSITSIVFTNSGTDGSMGFYLDDISIETGCVVQSSPLFNNGLTRVGNAVQFGGTLLHLTTLQTSANIMRFWGAASHQYPYQFRTTVPPNQSTGIVSFGHNDNSPEAVTLGVNFNNGIPSLYQTSFFGTNNVGYWIGTNIQGNTGVTLKQDDNTSKNSLIYFHTIDEGLNIGGVDIYSSPALGGTTIADMTPYKTASFLTTGQIQFPRYTGGVFDDTPTRTLGLDSNGTVVTYIPSGGGGGQRFGFAGEDTTGTGRHFTDNTTFHLTSGSTLIEALNGSFANSSVLIEPGGTTITVTDISNTAALRLLNSVAFGGAGGGGGLVINSDEIAIATQSASTSGTFSFVNSSASFNNVLPLGSFTRITTGNGGAGDDGVGGRIDFYAPTPAFNQDFAGAFIWRFDDVANRSSSIVFEAHDTFVTQEVLTIRGTGQLTANQYGSGTWTGTDAYWLAVTSAGNIIEMAPPSLGGISLDDLTDVTITSPSNGEALIYSGGAWSNQPAGRFGISGEDDTAAQNRAFDSSGFSFSILSDGGQSRLTINDTNAILSAGNGGTPITSDLTLTSTGGEGTFLLRAQTTGQLIAIDGDTATGKLTLSSGAGGVNLEGYGSATYSGTPTRALAVDSSGNVIEIPVPTTTLKEYTFTFTGNGTDDPTVYGELINTLSPVASFTYAGSTGQYELDFVNSVLSFGVSIGFGGSQNTNRRAIVDVIDGTGTQAFISLLEADGVTPVDPAFESFFVTIRSI